MNFSISPMNICMKLQRRLETQRFRKCTYTNKNTHSDAFAFSLCRSLSLTLSVFLSLSRSLSRSLALSRSLSFLSLAFALSLSLSLSRSLSLSLSLARSLSLSRSLSDIEVRSSKEVARKFAWRVRMCQIKNAYQKFKSKIHIKKNVSKHHIQFYIKKSEMVKIHMKRKNHSYCTHECDRVRMCHITHMNVEIRLKSYTFMCVILLILTFKNEYYILSYITHSCL